MRRAVVLDAGPVGLLSNPNATRKTEECWEWLRSLLPTCRVVLPEVADYEVRREVLRSGTTAGIASLDALQEVIEYVPITTEAMRRAAYHWAHARRTGVPTAHDLELDGDVILAGQAAALTEPNFIVATTNVAHISRYVPAAHWRDIRPS